MTVVSASNLSAPFALSVKLSPPPVGQNSPVPVAANLAGGVVGTAYSETVTVQGGAAPYSFAITSGSLPSGLSLNSSTGVISGTPTAVGNSTFGIGITDAQGSVGSQNFSITIAAAVISSPAGAGNYGWFQ